jgi:ABC-type phosphate transport system substrate-binding protein
VDLVLFFLYSDSLASLASLASFNTVPDLLRTAWQLETVITQSVRCPDGTLAGGSVDGQSASVLSLLGAVVASSVLDLAATSYSSDASTSVSVTYSLNRTQSAIAALVAQLGEQDIPASVAISSQIGSAQSNTMRQAAITALPLALVPVAPVFNLGSNITKLVLSTALLGDMYAGAVTHWNDSRIARLNPSVATFCRAYP